MPRKLVGRNDARERAAPGRPRKFAHGDVVAAALRVMEREGFAALTLRSLATELGISHSNLYNYVGHIEDVEAEVLQSLVSQARLPVSQEPAQLRVEFLAYLGDALVLLRKHPHVLVPPIGSPAWHTFARLTNAWIAALARHEPEPFMAMRAYSALVSYVATQAERERLYGPSHAARTLAALKQSFPELVSQYSLFEQMVGLGTDALVLQNAGALLDRLLPTLAVPAASGKKSKTGAKAPPKKRG